MRLQEVWYTELEYDLEYELELAPLDEAGLVLPGIYRKAVVRLSCVLIEVLNEWLTKSLTKSTSLVFLMYS